MGKYDDTPEDACEDEPDDRPRVSYTSSVVFVSAQERVGCHCYPARPECPGDDGPDGECGCPCHDAEPLR